MPAPTRRSLALAAALAAVALLALPSGAAQASVHIGIGAEADGGTAWAPVAAEPATMVVASGAADAATGRDEVPSCDGPEPSICGEPGCEDPMDVVCQPGCTFVPDAPGCDTCPAIALALELGEGGVTVHVETNASFTLLRSDNGTEPAEVGTFTGATTYLDADVGALPVAYAVVVGGVVCEVAFGGLPTCQELLGDDCPPGCVDLLAPDCFPPCEAGCGACPATDLVVAAQADGAVTVDAHAAGDFSLWRSEAGGEPVLLVNATDELSYVDTGTTAGVTYTYFVVADDELCDLGEVTAVPDIPLGLGAFAAASLGSLAYVALRRRA